MERIAEVLKLAVVVQRGRTAVLESQRFQEGELCRSGRAAERAIAQKLRHALFPVAGRRIAFGVFKVLVFAAGQSDRQRERRRIPFPRRDGRIEPDTLLHVAGLGGDVLHVTPRQRVRLDASVASWEWNPATFALAVRLAGGEHKHFEYAERDPATGNGEKGMAEFLRDSALSGSATPAELAFLKSLRFKDRRPTALYYYRELQNLRDPLHFRV